MLRSVCQDREDGVSHRPQFDGPSASLVMSSMLAAGREAQLNVRTMLQKIDSNRVRVTAIDKLIGLPAWSCIVSLLCYALVLTDVMRTGLGTTSHKTSITQLETDSYLNFGPFAYPVVRILSNASAQQQARVWSYKFDTTSVPFRAFAQHFGLHESSQWPPCFFYMSECSGDYIGFPTVLGMLDSLVDRANAFGKSMRERSRGNEGVPSGVTLRTIHHFYDRVHHYVLPWLFTRLLNRSMQLLHYDESSIQQLMRRPHLCAISRGRLHYRRPYFCDELWSNYVRSCKVTNPKCGGVGHVGKHIVQRVQSFQQSYPGLKVDLTVVESTDHFTRGSITFHGRKMVDIITIIRARNCSAGLSNSDGKPVCTTVALDDYRYETTVWTSTAPEWITVVSVLRVIGQWYAWFRVAFLVIGCFAARPASESTSHRVRGTLSLLGKIPARVAIYGSIVPVVCYAAAHVIDSQIMYELIYQRFASPLGKLQVNLWESLLYTSLQMRCVWLVAYWLQVVLWWSTSRMWSPADGVVGVRGFTIGVATCFVVFSQIRWLSLRYSKLKEIQPVANNAAVIVLQRWQHVDVSIIGTTLQGGNIIDLKFVACTTVLLLLAFLLTHLLLRCASLTLNLSRVLGCGMCQTIVVPCTAGTVWSTSSLVVAWAPTFHSDRRYQTPLARNEVHLPRTVVQWAKLHRRKATRVFLGEGSEPDSRDVLDTRQIRAWKLLMNVAMMSNPFTIVRMKTLWGHDFVLLHSNTADEVVLAPENAIEHVQDELDDQELRVVAHVNSLDMAWRDVICSC